MNADILPLAEPYFEQLRLAIDTVAREKRYLALTEAPPREEAFSFFRGLVDSGSPSVIALHDGQVIGWCDIQSAFGQARRHIGRLGVGLLPQARGQGIGARLMQAAIAKAWANGLTRIELAVRTDNHAARLLYERLGFQHEGVQRRDILIDGQYYDSHAMALLKETPDR